MSSDDNADSGATARSSEMQNADNPSAAESSQSQSSDGDTDVSNEPQSTNIPVAEPESQPEPAAPQPEPTMGSGSTTELGQQTPEPEPTPEPSPDPTVMDAGATSIPEPSVTPEPQADMQPEFMFMFTTQCMRCHGPQGQGIAGLAPEIIHPAREHAQWVVRNGDADPHPDFLDEMDAFSQDKLSDEILSEILDWLWEPPNATTGAELFADYCSHCHGADGRGGPDEYASAYHSAPFTRRQGQAFIDYLRTGHVMDDSGNPIGPEDRNAYMPPFAPEVLSDNQLRLIQAWLPQ